MNSYYANATLDILSTEFIESIFHIYIYAYIFKELNLNNSSCIHVAQPKVEKLC